FTILSRHFFKFSRNMNVPIIVHMYMYNEPLINNTRQIPPPNTIFSLLGYYHITIKLRKANTPKTRKLAPPGENVQFSRFGVL
ncbi:hypothetical protein ACQVPY_27355, partial [Bacillus pretiosus]|uniref:hypothetical protein n=1 Tax=Bacillus pretiosus TaxID=2983392 RepID=UPI003D64BC74